MSPDDELFEEYLELLGDGLRQVQAPDHVSLLPTDVLLVVDMQADLVQRDTKANPDGGRFGIDGGDATIVPVVSLIAGAVDAGSTVIATKAYHPHDHSSFTAQGGNLPPHCVQGTPGSKFLAPVANALAHGMRHLGPAKVLVAFRDVHETAGQSVIRRSSSASHPQQMQPGASGPLDAALVLKQSGLLQALAQQDNVEDLTSVVDTPPDALALCVDDGGPDRGARTLAEVILCSSPDPQGDGPRRLFVCGLPLDFAVLDLCEAAGRAGLPTYLVHDASRAAHIPGIGRFGSGFLMHPSSFVPRLASVGAKLLTSAELLQSTPPASPSGLHPARHGRHPSLLRRHSLRQVIQSARKNLDDDEAAVDASTSFPNALPSFGVVAASDLRASLLGCCGGYSLNFDHCPQLKTLHALGLGTTGSCAPSFATPRLWPGAPNACTHVCWANPLTGIERFEAQCPNVFLSLSANAELAFATFGGFLLLDAFQNVLECQSISAFAEPTQLHFARPSYFPARCTLTVRAAGRLMPVTIMALKQHGAKEFAWINPNETFEPAPDPTSTTLRSPLKPFMPPVGGAFVYVRGGSAPALLFELLPQPRQHVAFVTDIEGNWEYLLAWAERSEAIASQAVSKDGMALDMRLADGWRLVFGGDVCDKGGSVGGSLRLTTTFVRLKEKYGERVTLLAGNRDANKMRLTSEMHESQLSHAQLPRVPGPFWVGAEKRRSPLAHFTKQLAADAGGGGAASSVVDVSDAGSGLMAGLHANGGGAVTALGSAGGLAGLPPEVAAVAHLNTPFNRLQYILGETMGAAGEEERRRAELAHLSHRSVAEVRDEEVVQSFVDALGASGIMRRYLELAQLAALIDGTLYVHGGVVAGAADNDCLGMVPGHAERIPEVGAWVAALNAWMSTMVWQWIAQPQWADAARGPARLEVRKEYDARGGQGLIDYVVPGGPPGVVLSRHIDRTSMPIVLAEDVASRLVAGGVSRLIIGHTPHGSCPTIIRQDVHELHTVMADTSYSDMSSADNRGRAVSTVDVTADGVVKVAGVLPDGKPIAYALEVDDAYSVVGKLEPAESAEGGPDARRFVKARYVDSGDLLMCRHEGFKVEYSTLTWSMAEALFELTPAPGNGAEKAVLFMHAGDHIDDDALEAATLDALVTLFGQHDLDHSGSLCFDELREALVQDAPLLKVLSSTGDVAQAMASMDTHADGRVTIQEFIEGFGVPFTAEAQANWEATASKAALAKAKGAAALEVADGASDAPPLAAASAPTTTRPASIPSVAVGAPSAAAAAAAPAAAAPASAGWCADASEAENRAAEYEERVAAVWQERYRQMEARAQAAEAALPTMYPSCDEQAAAAASGVSAAAGQTLERCVQELARLEMELRASANGTRPTSTLPSINAAVRLSAQVRLLTALQRPPTAGEAQR